MSRQKQRVEIEHSDDGIIELRYFDGLRNSGYYSWEMPVEEADWWGRNYENAAKQVALQPEKDPATGLPAGVRVKKIEAGSIFPAEATSAFSPPMAGKK